MDPTYVPGRDPTPEEAAAFLEFTAEDLNVTKETSLYAPLCKVMQSALPEGTLVCKDTGDWPEGSDLPTSTSAVRTGDGPGRRKTDICFYEDDPVVLGATTVRWTTVTDTDRVANMARVIWAQMVAFLEAKVNVAAFGMGPDQDFLPTSVDATDIRGQMAEYAAEILVQQHRTHVFMIYVHKDRARLARFDRAGCVISDSFNLVTESKKLLNFVFRLGQMTRSERGYDDTVELASDMEVGLMKNHLPSSDDQTRMAAHIRDALATPGYPIHKVIAPGKEGEAAQHFLIGRLRAGSRYPTGRGTKGFIAFDLQKPRFVFIKDGWRLDSGQVSTEMHFYDRLAKNHVRNVPTVLCGGDIGTPIQQTITQSFLTSESTVKFSPRIHHRIVFEEIGIPLEEHNSSQELCKVVYDSILAHKDAYERAGSLHRDISGSNILIIPNDTEPRQSKGILIDWDLAKTIEQLKMLPTQYERSGTWYYLSALLLNYPKKPYELSDDLESFVHVINLQNLRFRKHDKTSNDGKLKFKLSKLLYDVYQESTIVDGFHVGSEYKLQQMQNGIPPYKLLEASSMLNLVTRLMEMCKEHYAALDLVDVEKNYGVKRTDISIEAPSYVPMDLPVPELDEPDLETQPLPLPPPPKRVLNTHKRIERIFATTLIEGRWVPKDKEQDQFLGLPYAGPRAETARGSCAPSGVTTGSKRQSNQAPEETSGVMKKRKTAEG
ncbi:unnamed protein product [Somion occarium]|uniref:Fungal-type protein kinase domain-containing protein n=1 Tax=Somion occarium TaxID=3059160 RepID=A0ABP1DVH5_9APHY